MSKECEHPCGAWASRGSSYSPEHETDFRLYDCLICGTRIRYYFNQGMIEELPSMGLVTAMLYENPGGIV